MSSQSRTKIVREVIAATVFAAMLAGCSDIYYDRRETVSIGAGDAVASNRAIHTIDPWPRHSANRNIAFNGERLQGAIERYRHHEVVEPRPESTSNLSSQQIPAATTTERIPTMTHGAGRSTPAAPVKGP
jgi:hypothetical protein